MVTLEGPWQEGHDWLVGVASKLQSNPTSTESLTVRGFLSKFDCSRRGSVVVSRIRGVLDATGLRTEPDFEYEHIDATISIKLASDVASDPVEETTVPSDGSEPQQVQHDSTLRMGSFKAARAGVISVAPDDALAKATTLMQLRRFSQLPVMTSDYTVKGAISWESIANCLVLGKECDVVSDCMVPAHEIAITTPLLAAVGSIAAHGYVLVRDEQNRISGIVTTSDLSDQFMQLAEPFLLTGEIEGYLRRLIQSGNFAQEELEKFSVSEDGGKIQDVSDLSFGEYCRILENPENWSKLNLNIDRRTFVESLHQVREIRNSIMHFNPGDTDEDTNTLRAVAQFLEGLAHVGL